MCPWATFPLKENIFPPYDIKVLPKCIEKSLKQWMVIIRLNSLVGVMCQVRCNIWKAV